MKFLKLPFYALCIVVAGIVSKMGGGENEPLPQNRGVTKEQFEGTTGSSIYSNQEKETLNDKATPFGGTVEATTTYTKTEKQLKREYREALERKEAAHNYNPKLDYSWEHDASTSDDAMTPGEYWNWVLEMEDRGKYTANQRENALKRFRERYPKLFFGNGEPNFKYVPESPPPSYDR